MPCINVTLNAYANGEVTLQQVVDEIMEQTAATQPPYVKREKGGDGKIYKAMLCFLKDTISKEDLKIARDICRGKRDIDFGIQFPLEFFDNIEALTAGDSLTDNKLLGNPVSSEIPFVRTEPDNATWGVRVSADGEGVGGSGKALAVTDLDTATVANAHELRSTIICSASDIDSLQDITSWKMSFDWKRSLTRQNPGDVPDFQNNNLTFASQSFVNQRFRIRVNPNNQNIVVFYTDSLGVNQSINTGVVWDGEYKKFTIEVLPNGTVNFDLNGEYSLSYNLGFAMPTPDLRILVAATDTYNTARAVAMEPIFLDNIEFDINDGTLV